MAIAGATSPLPPVTGRRTRRSAQSASAHLQGLNVATTIQYVLSGLAIGGIYALVALGFHIMWSAAKAVNFAHGDTLMIGAVLAVMGVDAGIPLPIACCIGIVAGGVFGLLLERFAVRSFAGTPTSVGWMLTTIAVGVMVEALATLRFGGFSRPLGSPGSAVHIFGAGVYPQELLIPLVAILVMIGLKLMQRHTLIGRAMQAVAHDKRAAALMGINVNRVVAFSFGLASLLGAAAGILVAPVIQVSASMGAIIGLKGFAVAIIGGITSAPGVVVAGFAFGIMEKFVEGYISTAAREIIGFSLMIFVLLIFPQGLFGKREVLKV
jgi:branched-chain amino acid transport system permease protein